MNCENLDFSDRYKIAIYNNHTQLKKIRNIMYYKNYNIINNIRHDSILSLDDVNKNFNIGNTNSKDKVVFIHIPKTAGISISENLDNKRRLDLNLYAVHGHELAKNIVTSEHKNRIILGIVRNPYNRLISIYNYLYGKKGILLNLLYDYIIHPTYTFKHFILNFEKEFYKNSPAMFTCFDYVTDDNNKLIPTDIIKFENLQTEYNDFCKKYNMETNILEHKNESKTKKQDITSIYTREMLDVVNKIFYNDFITFNYDFL